MSEAGVEVASDGKRQATEQLLTELLKLMDFPLRVETKDADDGGINVALFPSGDVSGFAPGKRSPVMDALQFLVNKVVNPPSGQRRWVTLGVGGFPAPRSAPAVAAPAAARPAALPPASVPARAQPTGASPPVARQPVGEESAVEVAPDPLLEGLGQTLSQRSSKLGRFYAVLALAPDDRARLLQASKGVEGVTVVVEGEGRNRRLVYRPDRPAPVARSVPDDEDD